MHDSLMSSWLTHEVQTFHFTATADQISNETTWNIAHILKNYWVRSFASVNIFKLAVT